jgi:putative endonuclease
MNTEIVFVYVLKSVTLAVRYVGITNNIERRMVEHRTKNDSVKRKLGEFQMILVESYENHVTARKREKWLKSGFGRAWLDEYEKNVGPAKGG